ncbi:MAG: glycosyltransferase family 4 protein [Candidatus Marsarchaeota archaeon]|jgi:glycosyltransferase involved in cell wall biosynthesis|nr:glycosyltransferase family 4 protein [Candidatus Marsarchaeota archaeon]MCL5418697.1 glycosyltransferase family 4 protein [Candidatus Marsarchaeota archaeon]
MDICVLNPYFYPYHGGTEKVLLQIYGRLARKHNICVIASAPQGQKRKSVDYIKGIRVVRLPARYFNAYGLPLPFADMQGLNDAIKDEHAELCHINNRYQYFASNIKAIKESGAKLALTIHNSLPKGIDPFIDAGALLYDMLIGRKTMHAADVITAVSRNTLQVTVPARDLWKGHVIYNGVDYMLFRHMGKDFRLGIAEKGANVVLNNGRLVKQKGQDVLIRAFAELEKEYDAELVIVGKGPRKDRLTSLAERLGVSKRLHFVTGIGEKALPKYYNIADMFVMPSLYEPAGLALMEAMACEIPPIASRVGGIPEVMGRCGIYIKPRDSNMIYSKMKFAIENRRSMRALAACARKRVMMNNDWDKIAKRYESLFLDTIKG